MLQTALRGRPPSAFYCTNARERQRQKIDKIFRSVWQCACLFLVFAVQYVIRSNCGNKQELSIQRLFDGKMNHFIMRLKKKRERKMRY